jgi:hypothetical protein
MQKLNLIWILIIGVVIGCKNNQNRFDGNKKMAALLEKLNQTAMPMDNYLLSDKRALLMAEKAKAETNIMQKSNAIYSEANEWLYAGEQQKCVDAINTILQNTGDTLATINPNNKKLHELKAIAYMRMGEVTNCLNNHTSASCILPLASQGFHKDVAGSTKAIEVFTKLLNAFPDDVQNRWLLNIAYMTLGQYPQGVPEKYRLPLTVFEANKNYAMYSDIAQNLGLDVQSIAGGVCAEDFNNDGNIDIMVSSYALNDQLKLFINNGDGSFKETTKEAMLTGLWGGINTYHADYNNDGFEDVLVMRGGWLDKGGNYPNSLLKNNGDGTFSDVTEEAGIMTMLPGETASFADYDGDGHLDLFVAREFTANNKASCEMYHNDGKGKFTNVALALDLTMEEYVKASIFTDVNNDQRPDLFISVLGGKNRLYVNRGGEKFDAWKFENISAKAGIEYPINSFPAAFYDYDMDGFQDLLLLDFNFTDQEVAAGEYAKEKLGIASTMERTKLYRNNGNETFTNVAEGAGISKVLYGMGLNYGDLDNNGYIDFYVGTGTTTLNSLMPNRLFVHNGKQYEDITNNGFGHLQKGHGIAFTDFDNDGDQDIAEVMGGSYVGDRAYNTFFENKGNNNKWITLKLAGTTCNKSAIGSCIKVDVQMMDGSKKTFYHTVNTGSSFGSQSLQQEIGLGNAKTIEAVQIKWALPNASWETITGCSLNNHYKITQGKAQAEAWSRKVIVWTTGGHNHNHSH